jgi:hypothetical protein
MAINFHRKNTTKVERKVINRTNTSAISMKPKASYPPHIGGKKIL